MVVVVADPILEPGSRPGGLDAPDDALANQHAECVVHRLKRDRADVGPHDLGDAVSCDVGLARYRPQDGQSLGRHLDTVLPEEVSWVSRHSVMVDQLLE